MLTVAPWLSAGVDTSERGCYLLTMTNANETTRRHPAFDYSALPANYGALASSFVKCECTTYSLPYRGAYLTDSRNFRHSCEGCTRA